MKITIIFLVSLLVIVSIQTSSATHHHHKLHKIVAGGGGAALLGKSLLKPKIIIGALIAKKLIKKKLVKKLLIGGAAALIAKKIIKNKRRSCCTNCVRRTITRTHHLDKRSITEMMSNSMKNLTRFERSADPKPKNKLPKLKKLKPSNRKPVNSQSSTSKMNLKQLVDFVRNQKAESCLLKMICQLAADANYFGTEGLQFGAKLLPFKDSRENYTKKYRDEYTFGYSNMGKPQKCEERKYDHCPFTPEEVILGSKAILK